MKLYSASCFKHLRTEVEFDQGLCNFNWVTAKVSMVANVDLITEATRIYFGPSNA